MAAGFKKRTVKSDKSIGDRLKEVRVRKKLSVTEVEEATRIRAKFISALESDSWDQIPSEVYGRGYLISYAEHLKINPESLLKQYERERELYARKCKDSMLNFAPRAAILKKSFSITPRSLAIGAGACALILTAGGLGMQISRFVSAPILKVTTPVEAADTGIPTIKIKQTNFVINGMTTSGASVVVNQEPVNVEGDGSFSGEVQLDKGVNAVVIKATNSKGKSVTEVVNVTVE